MSRLAMVSVRLIFVLFVSQTAGVVGTKLAYMGVDSDPLAPYAAIMPGQPVEALENYSCNWYTEFFQTGSIGVCRSNSEDDHFSSVNVSVDDLTIQSLVFPVSGPTIGDLARYWGRPVIGNYGGFYSARWYRGDYVVTAPLRRRFSYWLPVRYLIVEGDQASIS